MKMHVHIVSCALTRCELLLCLNKTTVFLNLTNRCECPDITIKLFLKMLQLVLVGAVS